VRRVAQSRDKNLGELLTLLHDSEGRWRHLAVEYRDWSRPLPTTNLVIHPGRNGPRPRWQDDGPFPRASSFQRRIWADQPDRVRVELVQGTRLLRVGVRNGSGWHRWDCDAGHHEGTITNPLTEADLPPLLRPPLLSPAQLIGSLWFEPSEPRNATYLDRPVLAARARPRTSEPGTNAITTEFCFDADTGVVLQRQQVVDGRPVQVTQASQITFDEAVPGELFALDLPQAGPGSTGGVVSRT
jgi:hypothetical protein